MDLKTQVKKDFLNLFYHELVNSELKECNSKLNLFILKIENNQFIYSQLINELYDSIITYALSRKELENLKDSIGGKRYVKAIDRLRNYTTNDGEFGEIMLYCLLESHLDAPKIFTKLELKTSSNDYVKGADGIHLLKLKENKFQLIFGESKLIDNLTTCLSEAFKSIKDFIKRDKNNIYDEINLLDSHLTQESYSEDMLEYLRRIIVPTKNSDTDLTKDNAFGIFATFDLKIDDAVKKMSNDDFREYVRGKVKSEVTKRFQHIKDKIKEYELYGYDFYIYILPFTELDSTRKKVIEDLTKAK